MPLAPRSLLLDIAAAGPRVVAAGERGHILYSDDQGRSWQQARVPTTQMLTAVYFIDGQRGWAVGHDGLILVSDDGGEEWRVQRDGIAVQQRENLEHRESAQAEVARLELALAAAGEDRSALEQALEEARLDLEDAELALEEPVFTSPLLDLWFQDAANGWAVGAFGTFLATVDGGRTWMDAAEKLDNPDEYHLNAITGDGRGRMLIAGEGGMLFRSTDAGNSWELLSSIYAGSWFGVVFSGVRDTLMVFGLRGNLFCSQDFGTSWRQALHEGHMTLAGGAANASGEVVVVGAVGTVLLSADGRCSFRRAMLPDRLGLSAALFAGEELILVGQGGAIRWRRSAMDE